VEGSLQKSGEHIQINTRLIDSLKGRNIWAKSFKKDLNDIFDAQDEITINILKSFYVESIHGSDAEFYFSTNSLEAINYFMKGRDQYSRYTCDDIIKARASYKKALEIDPGYAAAWAELAWARQYTKQRDPCAGSWEEARNRRNDYLAKALEIDSTVPIVHAILAEIHQENGQYQMGLGQLEKAIHKRPNSAFLYYKWGELLGEGGRSQDAIPLIERAIQLNPFYPSEYLFTLSQCYFFLHQYENGLEIAEQLLVRGQKEGRKRRMLDWGHLWSAVNLGEK
jgi:tetratricopeptide (TPR) repeat protein